jgi:small-conductance mechanosensitive channel
MTTINKSSMRLIAGAFLAISLLAFTFTQQEQIKEQAKKILQFETQISSLETLLSTETEANTQLRAENQLLVEENVALKDSISSLNTKVFSLQQKVQKHLATIKGIKSELALKEKKIKELIAELSKIKTANTVVAEKKIAVIKKEIAAVSEEKEQLLELQKDETNIQSETEEDLIGKEMELRRASTIESILKNTSVEYKAIELRKTRTSDPLKKIDEDGSNWVFTTVQFHLLNVDEKYLTEEYFALKIVNRDTGEELPYLESNPAYANADHETTGFTFQWRKNPMEIVYINMQAKTGDNYDAKIYFINEDKHFLLPASVIPIIRDGKIVK